MPFAVKSAACMQPASATCLGVLLVLQMTLPLGCSAVQLMTPKLLLT